MSWSMTRAVAVVAPAMLAILAAAPTIAAPAGAPVTPLAAHSLDEFAQTRDRPLFSPTRRPSAPPPAVAAAAPDPEPPAPVVAAPPDIALAGIIEDAKGARAIVKPKDGKTTGLRVGDEIEGWKATAIDSRRLVLAVDERSVTFTLFAKTASADGPRVVHQHPGRVIGLNAAGILTARYVGKPRR